MTGDEARLPRWGAFGAVAALGFVVQVSIIVLLTGAGLPVALATTAGVAAAVLHNAAWHERWTWGDRPHRGRSGARFSRVALSTGVVSLAGTVTLTTLYASALDAPVALANLLAVWSVGIANYLLLDRILYRGAA